ncbi:unnamed protein product [Owenia fusiformis]|uniref:Uncharacterized protein n=1 Tax=Owenia fusiformis TaxID=6347 RepID=A0A8J1UW62_OWEFU|nr:unnamed protein product [Owenia fusiformis]
MEISDHQLRPLGISQLARRNKPQAGEAFRYRLMKSTLTGDTGGHSYLRNNKSKTAAKRIQRSARKQRNSSAERDVEETNRSQAGTGSDIAVNDVQDNFDFDHEPTERPDTATDTSDTSQKIYLITCRKFGIVPSKTFYNSLINRTIYLHNQSLGAQDARACAISLVDNSTVTSLDLGCNDIGNQGACHLADMLVENWNITSLNLSENNIGMEGLERLTEILHTNRSIEHLDLSGNGFTDAHAPLLVDLLSNNFTIRRLVLHHNMLCEKGGKLLGPALRSENNDTLRHLDLGWNHIRREGGRAICQGILNSNLESVNLSWNGLYLDGSIELCKLLKHNIILEHLDISCNRINKDCLVEILKGLKKNTSLKTLKIAENPIGSEGAMAILRTVEMMPDSAFNLLDLGEQCVEREFVELAEKIGEDRERPLGVKHGVILDQDNKGKEDGDGDGFDELDPMMVLMECMKYHNLRLVDFFKSLDLDGSWTLTYEEFRNGLLSVNMPMSEKTIDRLIADMDADGDGEVDFKELLDGQKEYKRRLARMQSANRRQRAAEIKEGVDEEDRKISDLEKVKAKVKEVFEERRRQQRKALALKTIKLLTVPGINSPKSASPLQTPAQSRPGTSRPRGAKPENSKPGTPNQNSRASSGRAQSTVSSATRTRIRKAVELNRVVKNLEKTTVGHEG